MAAKRQGPIHTFLRFTDYISGADLCQLSPEVLQTTVCGSDGLRLERISESSRVDCVEFVSAPFPGFRISGSCSAFVQMAIVQVEDIMGDLRAKISPKAKPPKQKSSRPYHPLFSNPEGLLPLPVPKGEHECESCVRPLSEEECRRLISSPYLSAYKRRLFSAFSEAQTEAGDSSPELTTSSVPSLTRTAESEFDRVELAGCLPGVAGIRQSKDYKKIRRKITEIDELTRSRPQEDLDVCQRIKISKRDDYVKQLRYMLLNGFPEAALPDQSTEVPEDSPVEQEVEEPTPVIPETRVQPLVIPRTIIKKIKQESKKPVSRSKIAAEASPCSDYASTVSSDPQTPEPPIHVVEGPRFVLSVISVLHWLLATVPQWLEMWVLPMVRYLTVCWVAFFIGDAGDMQSQKSSRRAARMVIH